MVAIPSRHKSLFLLIGVVVLQILFLAIQIRRDSQGRLIRVWTVGAVTPFERAGASGVGGIRGIWNHYFALQNASRDNERLPQENAQLKLQLNELQNKADEADRLAKLLNFKQNHTSVPMLAARVIAASADSATQTLYLDRGEHDGIRRNMGVITPDGVVGKISETYPNTSQVLLLTDRDSGVGAMLVESHIQSPVGGVGEPLLAMKYVANDDTVAHRSARGHQRHGSHFSARSARRHRLADQRRQSLQADSPEAGRQSRKPRRRDRAALDSAARPDEIGR